MIKATPLMLLGLRAPGSDRHKSGHRWPVGRRHSAGRRGHPSPILDARLCEGNGNGNFSCRKLTALWDFADVTPRMFRLSPGASVGAVPSRRPRGARPGRAVRLGCVPCPAPTPHCLPGMSVTQPASASRFAGHSPAGPGNLAPVPCPRTSRPHHAVWELLWPHGPQQREAA